MTADDIVGRVSNRAIRSLVVATVLAAPLLADIPLPPPPRHYVADSAGLISESEAQRLDQKLSRFDEETSNQIVVAIFPELTSPSLEDFTVRTAQSWRVGRKKLDNGVVLFVFVKDRKVRLEVGYGLEGALPDALAKRIIDEQIAPSFRAGNYAQGVEAGVDAIMAATRGEYRREEKKPEGGALILVVIGGLLVLIFGVAALLPRVAPKATYDNKGWETLAGMQSLGYGLGRRRRRYGYWGGGGGSGGSGGSWGGGFSGGGGSFGGGGASGGW